MKRAGMVLAAAACAAIALSSWYAAGDRAGAAPACTLNFAVVAGGDYFTAANWNDAASPSTHRVPASSDYACVPSSVTGAVTLSTGKSSTVKGVRSQTAGGFVITSGTLTVTDTANGSSILKLTLNGGTVNGAGSLVSTGAGTWVKGTFAGTGSLTVATGSSLTLPVNNSGDRVLSRPMTNNGTVTVSPGLTSGLLLGGGAELTNATSGVVDLKGDNANVKPTTGGGSITNSGTVKRSSGAGSTTIAVPLTSALDGVSVEIGTLSLTGGGALSGTGALPSGTMLSFDGGTFTVTSADFEGAGTTRLGIATWQLSGTSTIGSDFTFNGGIVDGSGSLTLTGNGQWIKGTMTGGGPVTVATGALLSLPITTTGDRVLSRDATNEGTLDLSAGLASGVLLRGGASLVNASFGVIDLQGDNADIRPSVGGGNVVNRGVIRRSSGGQSSTIGVPVSTSLSGLDIRIGTLSLAGGGAISGSVSLVTSATLSFDGGTFIVSNAAFNGAGTTRLGPATWQLTGASSVDSGFVVDGGIVNGTGSLSLTGSTNWIKGTMTGGGTVNVATGASVLMPLTNTGSRVLSRPMTNQGTLTIAKGLTSGLDLGAGITLTNGTTGVIDLQGDDVGIKATSGSGTIVNGGVVERSTGAGTATIGVPLTSSFDDVHVQVGTLSLTGGGTFSGTGQLPQGTALSFDSGAFDIGDTDIHGNGTVNIGVATWHLSGTASVFSTLVINGGTIDGGGDLNLSGVDTWTRGTITGPSALHVGSGSLTLPATTAGDRVLARPLSLAGTLRVGPGLSAGLFVGSGVSITNDVGSLIELQGDRADIKATTGGGRVVNLGSVEHTGSGKATIAVELDNTGEVDVVGGALTATSTFDAYDPAMKAMTKGTYFLAGVLQFPNAGIVTNNAWIRLTGPSADIQDTGGVSALTALAANGPAGTIQLRGGRSLTAKPLTNDGLIDVDVSSTLSIPGDYTQSPTGTLAIGVGTTPGKLAVSKKATLAGTLELTTTNGFGPAIGASFVVSTYASRSGCFTTIAGRDLGGGRYLDVACAATKATATVKRVTISIDDVTATEGDDGTQSFTFTVSVNHARPDLAMSVNWATVGGTAKAPGDFAGGSGTLTWDAGDATPRTIVVKVKGDTLDEGDEAFSVVLSAASNVFITDGTGTGTIIDDDPAAAMVSRPDCTSGSVGTPWT